MKSAGCGVKLATVSGASGKKPKLALKCSHRATNIEYFGAAKLPKVSTATQYGKSGQSGNPPGANRSCSGLLDFLKHTENWGRRPFEQAFEHFRHATALKRVTTVSVHISHEKLHPEG